MVSKFNSSARRAVFFDSGFGGLNLLHECVKRLPDVTYYYISDSEHVPYGNRSGEEILSLTLSALKGIEELNPSALVIACNTVTAKCITALRAKFSFPVVGVQPAVRVASRFGGKCLLLATKATVESESIKTLLAECSVDVMPVACVNLAAYIEENIFSLPQRLPHGLLPKEEADVVVLGCTHYSFVKKQIEEMYSCLVVDGTAATADHFAKILGTTDHRRPQIGKSDHKAPKKPNIVFLGSDNVINEQVYRKYFTF